jgi:hypothetical protein
VRQLGERGVDRLHIKQAALGFRIGLHEQFLSQRRQPASVVMTAEATSAHVPDHRRRRRNPTLWRRQ